MYFRKNYQRKSSPAATPVDTTDTPRHTDIQLKPQHFIASATSSSRMLESDSALSMSKIGLAGSVLPSDRPFGTLIPSDSQSGDPLSNESQSGFVLPPEVSQLLCRLPTPSPPQGYVFPAPTPPSSAPISEFHPALVESQSGLAPTSEARPTKLALCAEPRPVPTQVKAYEQMQRSMTKQSLTGGPTAIAQQALLTFDVRNLLISS